MLIMPFRIDYSCCHRIFTDAKKLQKPFTEKNPVFTEMFGLLTCLGLPGMFAHGTFDQQLNTNI